MHVARTCFVRVVPLHDEDNADETRKTLEYLEACNKMFENGFLSHDMIKTMDSKVLRSIDEVYSFFTNWILEKGMCMYITYMYASLGSILRVDWIPD